ncbi:hypothetical protein V8J88_13535 [Massilia sp. W12]|uniref:hypothetical protein n=1 Tax=Massilia sp. W12 TaxID=3126507 RepID=UPI0030D2D848
MNALTIQLDPNVEVLNDDRGRIVLLPPDHRSPIRLPSSDAALVSHLRSGVCDLQGNSEIASLSEDQRSRFHKIAVALDRAGLLAGRRVAPGFRTIRFRNLTRIYDALAAALVRPMLSLLSVRTRSWFLLCFTIATLIGLVAVWWSVQGRMFASAITPYWLLGIACFLLLFPFIHEFSHALVGRLFGLKVTTVGAQHHGGFSWSPFVEVRHALLSSDPNVRIWIPLAGVVCNLFLALLTGLWLLSVEPRSLSAGVAGMLTLLLHIRVLIDGGRAFKSDASQALRIAKELLPPSGHVRLTRVMRGGHVIFFVSCICMVALSFKDFGIST